MEKNLNWKEVKSVDVQYTIAGVTLFFIVLTAIFGYGSLSISIAMVFVIVCVMGCKTKEVVELCNGLVEEEE